MKDGWEYKIIGSLCDIKTGKLDANAASPNGKYPFFTCSRETLKIDNYAYDCECVLVAGNGELNAKYYKGKFNAYQRTYIISLKPNTNEISTKYLYCFFSKYIETLRQRSIGGVIKYIKLGDLTNAQIPVPDYSRQLIIVEELDLLSSIIEKKKAQLNELDNLAQSLFYEMFGDPITNEKGWEVKPLGKECTELKYGTSKPACENGKYKYLRMGNLTINGELDLSSLKTIDIPDDEVEKCVVRYGDILFNRTNSLDLIGKTCMFNLDEPMVIAGYIIRVRLSLNLNPRYISAMFNMPRMKLLLKKMAKGAVNQANINSKELASILTPIPPLDLQQQFASKIEAIEHQKELIKQSIKEVETLFNSRMDYYFN